jgi:hypothetical protein
MNTQHLNAAMNLLEDFHAHLLLQLTIAEASLQVARNDDQQLGSNWAINEAKLALIMVQRTLELLDRSAGSELPVQHSEALH